MEKFQRKYSLKIQVQETQSYDSAMAQDYLEISNPITLEFDINRNVLAEANTGVFRIYNLNELTRHKIYKDLWQTNWIKRIELRAGYVSLEGNTQTLPLIFVGNIKQAWSVREGVNFITHIEAYDGGYGILNLFSNTTAPKETSYSSLIQQLHNDMKTSGLTSGAIGTFSGSLPRGNSYCENTFELLQKITNASTFIDLEKIYSLNDYEAFKGNLPKISSTSGLLQTPRREQSILSFDLLFEPRLLVGQILELESITSKDFNGTYKVIGIKHAGVISDSISGDAITNVSLFYGSDALKEVVKSS